MSPFWHKNLRLDYFIYKYESSITKNRGHLNQICHEILQFEGVILLKLSMAYLSLMSLQQCPVKKRKDFTFWAIAFFHFLFSFWCDYIVRDIHVRLERERDREKIERERRERERERERVCFSVKYCKDNALSRFLWEVNYT